MHGEHEHPGTLCAGPQRFCSGLHRAGVECSLLERRQGSAIPAATAAVALRRQRRRWRVQRDTRASSHWTDVERDVLGLANAKERCNLQHASARTAVQACLLATSLCVHAGICGSFRATRALDLNRCPL
jgi:hypothetical protein